MPVTVPPFDQSLLKQVAAGIAAPPVWPNQNATIIFNWSQYMVGAAVESIAGWTHIGATPGAAKINNLGGVDFTTSTADAYLYNTGHRAHYVEANLLVASNISFPLAVRIVDQNNFIGVRVNSSTVQVEVYACVAGVFTELFSIASQTGLPPYDTYRLEAYDNDTVALYCEGLIVGTSQIPTALSNSTNIGFIALSTTANILGNLSLYEGPPLHGTGVTGSWWNGDGTTNAVSAEGKTWFTSVTQTASNRIYGALQISQIDHVAGTVSTYTLISGAGWGNNQQTPVILIRPDGRLIAFYCQVLSTIIRYRISVNPYDSTAWGSENIYTGVTYSAGVQVTSTLEGVVFPAATILSAEVNTIYLMFLCFNCNLCYATSVDLATVEVPTVDGGTQIPATWSAANVFVPTPGTALIKGLTFRIHSNEIDRIDLMLTYDPNTRPSTTQTDVRHVYYKAGNLYTTSGQLIQLSTGLGNFITTNFTAVIGTNVLTVPAGLSIVPGMSVVSGGYISSGAVVQSVSGTTVTLNNSSTVTTAATNIVVYFIPYNYFNLTAIATSGLPDNIGYVTLFEITRNTVNGYIQVVFSQSFTSNPGNYPNTYWYAFWNGIKWNKLQIPNTITGTLSPLITAMCPGIALDPEIPGLVYAAIGDITSTKSVLYRLLTQDGGQSWSSVLLSPPDVVGDQYAGQNFSPCVPLNRDNRCGVLWLRGRYVFSMFNNITAVTPPYGSVHCEAMSAPV